MFIVNLGWGKCGTTLLDRYVRTNQLLNYPGEKKELNFFRGNAGLNMKNYRGMFSQSRINPSSYFESSPSYLTGGNHLHKRKILSRIKSFFGDNLKIIICVRHPVYRAFSHYIHDIQVFSRFGAYKYSPNNLQRNQLFNNVYANSFPEAISLQSNVNVSYYEDLMLCLEVFGEDSIDVFCLERDASSVEQYFSGLADRYGFLLPEQLKDVGKVLEGGRLPTYFYSADCDHIISCNNKEMLVKKGEMAVVTGKNSIVYSEVTPSEFSRVMKSTEKWTSSLSELEFSEIHDKYFEEDFDRSLKVFDLLGTNLTEFYSSFRFSSKQVKLHEYTLI
ncbi:hypothetical protein G8764_09880 [Pseudomaricurvus alcaniphilus]|uniref:hypothetical protein n=1 Tax=Pseudomaricurvus alcaniphilus TaxID=1166482 RepID=UPI00140C440C|nr:hypothetical protein [Pseudomaricurvus alcaniphilus]NHN37601.1 hypothetical protein [Pseudomaricurvus alcaniphilus]